MRFTYYSVHPLSLLEAGGRPPHGFSRGPRGAASLDPPCPLCAPLCRDQEKVVYGSQNRGLRMNAASCPVGTRAQVATRVQIKADCQEAELGTHTLTLTAELFQAWTGLGEWPTLGSCFRNHGPERSTEVGEG